MLGKRKLPIVAKSIIMSHTSATSWESSQKHLRYMYAAVLSGRQTIFKVSPFCTTFRIQRVVII